VAEILKKLLQANQVKDKLCVAALSGQQVMIRLIKLPPMGEEEAKQAVFYQSERYIPFPVEQVVMDVKLLGEVAEGDKKTLLALLVAAQKEAVNALAETLSSAGLKLYAIDVEPFVSLRASYECAFSGDDESLQKNILFVELGASSSDISVVSQGILRFSRVIPIAGINVTRALATTMNVNFEEAEKTKKELGAAIVDDELQRTMSLTAARQVSNIMAPLLGSLMNEVQRSLAYYESRYRRARIDEVVLSGGGSKMRNIGKYFTRELGLEVKFADPLKPIQSDGAHFTREYVMETSPLCSVCAGLAMRDITYGAAGVGFDKEIVLDNSFEFGSSRSGLAAGGPAPGAIG
jgi:type IV pilus assembly protein PilM